MSSYQCYDQGIIKGSANVGLGVTKDINNCKTACSNRPDCFGLYYKNDNILNGKSPCTLVEGKTPTDQTINLSETSDGRFHRYCLQNNVVPNNATLTNNTASSQNANTNSPATKTEPAPEDKAAFAMMNSLGLVSDFDPKSSSNGYIIWIVLGVIFGIIVIAVIAYLIYRATRPKPFFS